MNKNNENKRILLYLIYGILTVLINIIVYIYLYKIFRINSLVANILAWIIAVFFAYITNTIVVFDHKPTTFKKFLGQILSFFTARCITLIIEEIILMISLIIYNKNILIVKLIAQIIVVILNYILSKVWIYKRK